MHYEGWGAPAFSSYSAPRITDGRVATYQVGI